MVVGVGVGVGFGGDGGGSSSSDDDDDDDDDITTSSISRQGIRTDVSGNGRVPVDASQRSTIKGIRSS